jgi:hypothetical protein
MRKNEHNAVVTGLKNRIADLEKQRDDLLRQLHGKADAATAAIGKLGDDIAGLGASVRGELKAHGDALKARGRTVTGAADAVRAAAAPAAAPGTPAVTPIKRGSRAAG